MGRNKIVCRAPGCDKALGPSNTSGVCKDHAHVQGACRCVKCLGLAQRRQVRGARADVRRVVMTFGERQVGVSLKREPWLDGVC